VVEAQRPDRGYNISPSSKEPIRAELERRLSAANPPLDSQRERNIHLSSDDIQAIAKEFSKIQKKGVPHTLIFGSGMVLGAGLAIGGFYADKIFADESIREPTPAREDISSINGPTSHTDTRIVDDKVVPKAEPETKKVNPEEAVENSNPNPIKPKKFKIPPSNREPSEDISSQHMPIDQLSTIEEHTVIPPGSTINYYKPSINFRLEGRTETSTARRVTPQGIEPIEQESTYYPDIMVGGYVIAKEIQPDGTAFLAVHAPGENGLSNSDDAKNPVLSVKNTTDDGNEGKIYNTIVWLKAENFVGYSPPFYSNATWYQEGSTSRTDRHKQTNIPEEVFKYIQIGDTLSTAGGMLQAPSWAEDLLVQNYRDRKNKDLTYDEAREKYLNIMADNAATLQRMREDAKTGGISLQEQFDRKRYIVQPTSIHFVARK